MYNFQRKAAMEGVRYRDQCADRLARYGFTIIQFGLRVNDCGVDVDIVAANMQGVQFLIECKGGTGEGKKQPGFESSDNIRKAIASAFCLSRSDSHSGQPFTPLFVMTDYIVPTRSANYTQLSVVPTALMLDVVSSQDYRRLKYWGKADYYVVLAHQKDNPCVTDSVEGNGFWAGHTPRIEANGELTINGATGD
ncbi:MAG: hypothetical protein KDD75_03895 [Caldilineaceae bacterium]|nr:hypothetical protein [Caldilineaceae bacterium]